MAVGLVSTVAAIATEPPTGWTKLGNNPGAYSVYHDLDVRFHDAQSVRLRSITRVSGTEFGTVMQEISAAAYRGHRVRFSGQVRARNVSRAAALWLRADGYCRRRVAFENTEGRASKGTEDWKAHAIVLDIPESAIVLAFGVLLSGTGDAWFADLKLETVGDSVPVTALALPGSGCMGSMPRGDLPSSPVNLDFANW